MQNQPPDVLGMGSCEGVRLLAKTPPSLLAFNSPFFASLMCVARYAAGDAVESWLNDVLCLDADHKHANANRLVSPLHDARGEWLALASSSLSFVFFFFFFSSHVTSSRPSFFPSLRPKVCGTPAPRDCELFWVDRDALFSHHKLSEAFLQRVMSMYVIFFLKCGGEGPPHPFTHNTHRSSL
jgi:hypothetical protein